MTDERTWQDLHFLADELIGTEDLDELEDLGWEAGRSLLVALTGLCAQDDLELHRTLGGNPALSYEACERLCGTCFPGYELQILWRNKGAAVALRLEGLDFLPAAYAPSVARAWLAAMLRAKAAL
jgi:hypothetical protein